MKLPSLKNIQIQRSWLILGAAVLIGLLAAWAASSYLSNRVADLEKQANGRTVSVVVAKADLPKGSRLSSDNLAVRAIPQSYAHSGSVLPEQFDRIDGENLAFPVKAGEAILWSLMESKRAPTFSSRVEIGRRALTLPVDEINSISGMLEPGDLIDLMHTQDQQGKKATYPILQSVRIMATGQRAMDDPKSGEKRMYSTVTLDTDPQEALELIAARDSGRLTAILRNPEDIGTDPAHFASAGAKGKRFQFPGNNDARQVPVLYGGRSGKIPPEGLQLGQFISGTATSSSNSASALPDTPVTVPMLQGGPGSNGLVTPSVR